MSILKRKRAEQREQCYREREGEGERLVRGLVVPTTLREQVNSNRKAALFNSVLLEG